jgi:hypothetical protein
VSSDPNDRCSREYGIKSVASVPPEKTRATVDYLLARCKTSLSSYQGKLPFSSSPQEHFAIPTECEGDSPFDGTIHVVQSHLHTRGASARVETQNDDGSWRIVLDIPRWRWTWEAAYLLEQGVSVKRGQKIRVSCTFDNGTANQWSEATGEPGHDRPAMPPLVPPAYVVAGPERGADMCSAFLTIAPAPHKGASYASICHEAQARYDDLCQDGYLRLVDGPCDGQNEERSVTLLKATESAAQFFFCGPKDPASVVGGTCGKAFTCSLSCKAASPPEGGVPSACSPTCKSNVNTFDPGQPALAASRRGAFHYDHLLACAEAACGNETTWQSYFECTKVACTDLVQWCYR